MLSAYAHITTPLRLTDTLRAGVLAASLAAACATAGEAPSPEEVAHDRAVLEQLEQLRSGERDVRSALAFASSVERAVRSGTPTRQGIDAEALVAEARRRLDAGPTSTPAERAALLTAEAGLLLAVGQDGLPLLERALTVQPNLTALALWLRDPRTLDRRDAQCQATFELAATEQEQLAVLDLCAAAAETPEQGLRWASEEARARFFTDGPPAPPKDTP